MPNITRGGRMGGLIAYLTGPAREGGNEHVDPHLVAGDPGAQLAYGGHVLERGHAQGLARLLDHPRQAYGTRVTMPVRGRQADEPTGGVAVAPEVKDADVWHCSLSLRAEEGTLSDERWARISEQFVARMGFADPEGEEAPCRWVALRHGLSKGGNDHVHLVVSLVREDGTAASTWNDRPRAQQIAGELEREHGLQVLESRSLGRGSRGFKPAERGIAERRGYPTHQGQVLTGREQLTRTVRACAAASDDEAEFVRRAVRAGVRIRPRMADGHGDQIAGYSVALRTPRGQQADWYGGGRLARDLSLPRLREGWPDTPEHRAAALEEWGAARSGQGAVRPGREADELDPGAWRQAEGELRALRERMRAVPASDHATWAHVARETAGAFAAWSLRTETDPGPLAATAEALARSAQLRSRGPARAKRAPAPSARGAARLLASIGHGGSGPVAQAALLRQLASTARAIHDAHQAAGDTRRAAEIAQAVRAELSTVAARLPELDTTGQPVDEQATQAARLARQGRGEHGPAGPAPGVPAPRPGPSGPVRPDTSPER